MSSRPRAFVLPAAAPNGYGTIRSLAEAGIDVLGLDHASSPVGRSRHCQTRIIPDPALDLAGFHTALNRLAEAEPTAPVLFPVQDYHVQALHMAEPGFRDRVRYPFLTPQALRNCLDKRVMHSRARAHAIERGTVVELNIDGSGDSVWIQAGTERLEVVNFSDALDVDLRGYPDDDVTLCMSPRGFAKESCNSFKSLGAAFFVAGDEILWAAFLPLGQLVYPDSI